MRVKNDDEGHIIKRCTLKVIPWQTIFMSEYSPLRRRFFRSSCSAVRGVIASSEVDVIEEGESSDDEGGVLTLLVIFYVRCRESDRGGRKGREEEEKREGGRTRSNEGATKRRTTLLNGH